MQTHVKEVSLYVGKNRWVLAAVRVWISTVSQQNLSGCFLRRGRTLLLLYGILDSDLKATFFTSDSQRGSAVSGWSLQANTHMQARAHARAHAHMQPSWQDFRDLLFFGNTYSQPISRLTQETTFSFKHLCQKAQQNHRLRPHNLLFSDEKILKR